MLELDVSNQRNNKYLPKVQKETDVQSHSTSNSSIESVSNCKSFILLRHFCFPNSINDTVSVTRILIVTKYCGVRD